MGVPGDAEVVARGQVPASPVGLEAVDGVRPCGAAQVDRDPVRLRRVAQRTPAGVAPPLLDVGQRRADGVRRVPPVRMVPSATSPASRSDRGPSVPTCRPTAPGTGNPSPHGVEPHVAALHRHLVAGEKVRSAFTYSRRSVTGDSARTPACPIHSWTPCPRPVMKRPGARRSRARPPSPSGSRLAAGPAARRRRRAAGGWRRARWRPRRCHRPRSSPAGATARRGRRRRRPRRGRGALRAGGGQRDDTENGHAPIVAVVASDTLTLDVEGVAVPVSHPGKPVFPGLGLTKLDLIRYYLAVADGALRGVARPADDPQTVRQGHRRGGVLPEARAREAAGLDRRGRAQVRLRHVRRRRPCCTTPPAWRGR